MKFSIFIPFLLLMSCSSLPILFQSAEDIFTHDGIEIMVSKEILSKSEPMDILIVVSNNPEKR